MSIKHGPIILDLLSTELSAEEREILEHPLVGGVIFFTRNYESPAQIQALAKSIRAARKAPILLAVDQEGGRVQRFREGFTRIPPMGWLGQLYNNSPDSAVKLAEICGWLIAAELLSVGIDLSFAPVLDLNKQLNTVIADRAFHRQPEIVISLAQAVMRGMNKAGMRSVGKHFPGHGSVNLDSHIASPVDQRPFSEIEQDDLIPFKQLISSGLQGMMPAHIVFPAVDAAPVGFSALWLKQILREQLQFKGIIFSDDLNMEGAGFAGNYHDRAKAALEAGCDMVLICNNRPGAIQIIDQLSSQYFVHNEKFCLLQGRFDYTYATLFASREWRESNQLLNQAREQYEYH